MQAARGDTLALLVAIRGAPFSRSFAPQWCQRPRIFFNPRSTSDERTGGRAQTPLLIIFSYFPDAKTHRRELWQGACPPSCRVTPPFFSQHRWSISPAHNRRGAIWEIYSLFHAEKVNISSSWRVINFCVFWFVGAKSRWKSFPKEPFHLWQNFRSPDNLADLWDFAFASD